MIIVCQYLCLENLEQRKESSVLKKGTLLYIVENV